MSYASQAVYDRDGHTPLSLYSTENLHPTPPWNICLHVWSCLRGSLRAMENPLRDGILHGTWAGAVTVLCQQNITRAASAADPVQTRACIWIVLIRWNTIKPSSGEFLHTFPNKCYISWNIWDLQKLTMKWVIYAILHINEVFLWHSNTFMVFSEVIYYEYINNISVPFKA